MQCLCVKGVKVKSLVLRASRVRVERIYDATLTNKHMDFHYLQRVKVYRLSEEGKWDDKGTGHVAVEYLERSHVVGLVVIDEEDNETLLVHHISADDIYRRQEDTIIAWRDPDDATELALSFQESTGCAFIWDQICSVQRSVHFPSLGASGAAACSANDDIECSGTTQANGGGSEIRELPQVELSTLPLIFKTVVEGSVANHIHVAELIAQDHSFMPKLLGLFKICEDGGNTEGIYLIFKIIKGIISLNSLQIYELIFSDEYIMDVVGALEYDPELTSQQEHRMFLKEQVKFKEAMPIRDPSILSKIHQTYRVGYIKDVILPRVLDDVTFTAINSIIHSNNSAVMSTLKEDTSFMHEMFVRLKSPDTPLQAKKDLVLFLQEFCSLSKSLQLVHQMRLIRNLASEGLLDIATEALQNQDNALRLSGANILILVLNQDPSLLRTFVAQQDGHTLLGLLVKGISTEFGGDMYSQFLEILRMLLDPYTMAGSQRDTLLEIFYDKYMDQLIDVITSACPAKGRTKIIRKSTCHGSVSAVAHSATPETLSNICDFLCFCVVHHPYRKYYFMRNSNIERVLCLLYRKEKYLVVAAVRFLRTIISRNDDTLHHYIVKNNLFQPVIQEFITNGNRYNLLNSAVLELIEYIRKENFKSIIAYLVENYSDQLEKIDYVDTFQQLKLKYEQSLEGYPPRDALVGGIDLGGLPPRHLNKTIASVDPRKRNDDRVPDKEEEDYFNNDSDDEADSRVAQLSVHSQTTHAVVGNGSMSDPSAVRGGSVGLVDYEDEDDDTPVPVSANSRGTDSENLEIALPSLVAKDNMESEAIRTPKSKRRFAKAESVHHGREALKKHRLHINIKYYSATIDREKAQHLEAKEKQGSLNCGHENNLEFNKEENSTSEVELLEEKDCLASKYIQGNKRSKAREMNDNGSDARSSMSKEGFGSNKTDNEINEQGFVKEKINENSLNNASHIMTGEGRHLLGPDSGQ